MLWNNKKEKPAKQTFYLLCWLFIFYLLNIIYLLKPLFKLVEMLYNKINNIFLTIGVFFYK